GRAQGGVEGRGEVVRVSEGRQDVSIRRRLEKGGGGEGGFLVGRRYRGVRPVPGPGARTTGRFGAVAGGHAQGVSQGPQPLAERPQRRDRNPDHDRRQRREPRQVRQGELGLRRGIVPGDRDLVVAGRQEGRLLPV